MTRQSSLITLSTPQLRPWASKSASAAMPSIISPRQNRRLLPGVVATLQAGDGEQSSDQFVQALGFEVDALERAVRFDAGALMGQGGGHVKTGEWRPQFVRNVVEQSGLGVDRRFQAFRHGVEIAHQLRHLVAAPGSEAARPGAQIARRQTLRSSAQADHRRRSGIAPADNRPGRTK